MAKPNSQRVERRKISALRSHPLQERYYDALPPHKLAELAADIARNGLRDRPHVLPRNRASLPPNTILDGHMRVRAFESLGQSEIDVVVRHDLADSDAATVEREFLEFNYHRRQLDRLAKARVALRLFEIEKGRRCAQLGPVEYYELRDRVGAAIGMSGRNVSRYLRVLRTPIEVQNAFQAEKLPLVVAERVDGLDPGRQQEIARRIRDGEEPGAVVADYLPRRDGRHKRTADAFAGFVRGLQCGLRDLDGRVDRVGIVRLMQSLPDLIAARDVLVTLITRAHNSSEEYRAAQAAWGQAMGRVAMGFATSNSNA